MNQADEEEEQDINKSPRRRMRCSGALTASAPSASASSACNALAPAKRRSHRTNARAVLKRIAEGDFGDISMMWDMDDAEGLLARLPRLRLQPAQMIIQLASKLRPTAPNAWPRRNASAHALQRVGMRQ